MLSQRLLPLLAALLPSLLLLLLQQQQWQLQGRHLADLERRLRLLEAADSGGPLTPGRPSWQWAPQRDHGRGFAPRPADRKAQRRTSTSLLAGGIVRISPDRPLAARAREPVERSPSDLLAASSGGAPWPSQARRLGQGISPEQRFFNAAVSGDVAEVTALLRQNVSLGHELLRDRGDDANGLTWAVNAQQFGVVQAMLKIDPSMASVQNSDGESVLYWAAWLKDWRIFRAIIDTNSSLLYWVRASDDMNLLFAVAGYGVCWPQAAKFLLDMNSDFFLSKLTKWGETPLWIASRFCCAEVVQMILTVAGASGKVYAGASPHYGAGSALAIAAQKGTEYGMQCTRTAEILLSAFPTLANEKDANGMIPLMSAAKFGPVGLVQTLIRANRTSASTRDAHGRTALLWATCGGKYASLAESATALASAMGQASLDAKDMDNNTAFTCAMKGLHKQSDVEDSDIGLVGALLRAGVDYGYPDGTSSKDWRTACAFHKVLDNPQLYPTKFRTVLGHWFAWDFFTAPAPTHMTEGYFYLRIGLEEGFGGGFLRAWELLKEFVQIDGPAILTMTGDNGTTLLMEAAMGHLQPTRKLPQCPPHSTYCRFADNGTLQILLDMHTEAGVPVSLTTEQGRTSLMLAALNGRARNVDLLKQQTVAEDPSRDEVWVAFLGQLSMGGFILCCLVFALALCFGTSEKSQHRAARDFLIKACVLTLSNTVAMYAAPLNSVLWSHTGALPTTEQHAMLVITTPWSMLPSGYGVILAASTLSWTCFTLADFHDAWYNTHVMDDEVEDLDVFSDIYHDVDYPFVNCILVFTLASTFMAMYVQSIYVTIVATLQARSFWHLALLVQLFVAEGPPDTTGRITIVQRLKRWARWATRMDTPYKPAIWRVLFSGQAGICRAGKDEGQGERLATSRVELVARFLMSYISNGLFSGIILYTIPSFLAKSGMASDFMLNAFAVTFISDLDNLESDKKYCLMEESSDDSDQDLSFCQAE